jgi:hypothetical protein
MVIWNNYWEKRIAPTKSVQDLVRRRSTGEFAGYQVKARFRYWPIPKSLRAEFIGAWLIKRGILIDAPNAPQTGSTR